MQGRMGLYHAELQEPSLVTLGPGYGQKESGIQNRRRNSSICTRMTRILLTRLGTKNTAARILGDALETAVCVIG